MVRINPSADIGMPCLCFAPQSKSNHSAIILLPFRDHSLLLPYCNLFRICARCATGFTISGAARFGNRNRSTTPGAHANSRSISR